MAPTGTNNKKGKGSGGGRKAVPTTAATNKAIKKRPLPKTGIISNNNAGGRKSATTQISSSSSPTTKSTTTNTKIATTSTGSISDSHLPTPSYLISCDIPTKQYIIYLNEQIVGGPDKKFIIQQDLDATHLLIKPQARDEIGRQLDVWFDENIFSAIEKVGEDFDVS